MRCGREGECPAQLLCQRDGFCHEPGSPLCLGDGCSDAISIPLGTGQGSASALETASLTDNGASSCGPAGTDDAVFRFVTELTSTLVITVRTAATAPLNVSLRTRCEELESEIEHTCTTSKGGDTLTLIRREAAAGEYFLIVDGVGEQGVDVTVTMAAANVASECRAAAALLLGNGARARVSASGPPLPAPGTCGSSETLALVRLDAPVVDLSIETQRGTTVSAFETGHCEQPIACFAPASSDSRRMPRVTLALSSTEGQAVADLSVRIPTLGDSCLAALELPTGRVAFPPNAGTLSNDRVPCFPSDSGVDVAYQFTYPSRGQFFARVDGGAQLMLTRRCDDSPPIACGSTLTETLEGGAYYLMAHFPAAVTPIALGCDPERISFDIPVTLAPRDNLLTSPCGTNSADSVFEFTLPRGDFVRFHVLDGGTAKLAIRTECRELDTRCEMLGGGISQTGYRTLSSGTYLVLVEGSAGTRILMTH